MICRLPASVHQALLADTARAMARRTPAVAQAAAEARALVNARLMDAVDAPPVPTTAFDLFSPDVPPLDLRLHSTPREGPNPFMESAP